MDEMSYLSRGIEYPMIKEAKKNEPQNKFNKAMPFLASYQLIIDIIMFDLQRVSAYPLSTTLSREDFTETI